MTNWRFSVGWRVVIIINGLALFLNTLGHTENWVDVALCICAANAVVFYTLGIIAILKGEKL